MNKKAIFVPFVALLTVIIFSYAYYSLIVKTESAEYANVAGARALELREADIELSKTLFYNEENARVSAYSALVKLAEKGGGDNDWGNFDPTKDLDKNFLKEFEELFYTKSKEVYSFNIQERGDNLVLISNSKEEILEDREFGVGYGKKHKFELIIDYDLNIYKELYSTYKGKNTCSEFTLKDDMKCDDSSEENYIKFEVKQKLLFVNPVIKFKVLKPGKFKTE